MTRQQSLIIYAISSAICFGGAGPSALAGVNYLNPAGGWRYTYDGTFNPGVVDGAAGGMEDRFIGDFGPAGFGGRPAGAPPDGSEDVGALDGTWSHNQGDKWDGTAPGDTLSDPTVSASPAVSLTGKQGTSPGGAGAFTDGSTSYIRIQDAGNPESHGWIQGLTDPNLTYPTGPPSPPNEPINTNRRVYFGHDMTQEGPLDELVLTNTGLTVSFRTRIPVSGPLDDLYLETDGDDLDTDPDVIPWFQDAPNGRGAIMSNGRGILNFSQNSPTNEDTMVGFSMVTSTDISAFCGSSTGSLCTGTGSGGLIMNNLNGNVPSNFIDSENGGTLNILEIGDNELNQWNEFWITMENNGPLPGNIEVKVYMNGSLTPSTFQVTLAANNNSVYAQEDNPFLEFGISDNAGWGSFDLDFLSYQIGVIAPVAAPVENADFDGDGDVDGRDFLIWQRGFNIGTTAAQGDANGDNMVNGADLQIWQNQYGTNPLTATFTSIPEPGALALGLVAALSIAMPGRRRR